MTKSSKAKKARKADFTKQKIKVGKKLKKAQNETRTDFKARKIILKEQLVEKSDKTLVTKKHHSVKELVTRLEHHSAQVRKDGVKGIMELVTHHNASEIIPYLSKLILAISPMILDTDFSIRGTAVNCIQALITKLGPNMQPYFTILSTYLSCAMAHLNVGVQTDSLKLINILVVHTPSLIARHANTLLKNFIDLISRKASGERRISKTKNVGGTDRVLHVNPDSALSGHKFRVKLLSELSAFLEALVKEQKRVESQIPHSMWQTVLVGSVPPLLCVESVQSDADGFWLFSDPNQLNNFSNTIVPLLFDVWAEVDPQASGCTAVDTETIETLECIMNIVKHMWDITQICTQENPKNSEWVVKEFQSKFSSRLMSGFPYLCKETPKTKKNKKRKSSDTDDPADAVDDDDEEIVKHCDNLNISLSEFAMQLCTSNIKQRVISYLTALLSDSGRDGEYKLENVVKMILSLLQIATKSEVQRLVIASQMCYARLHPLKKDRGILLQILLVATDHDHTYLWRFSNVNLWVEQIVSDLENGEVTERVLQVALILRLRGNTRIKKMLHTRRSKIRDQITSKGIKTLTEEQIERKLEFLLKDLM
ncbi:testis-expressed protein 10-like [Penaeus japonicus]|uniref:testis-expressed protein 10-like n=1 Tax=Penaeus japonicus TaxID=27405 RepID=UPI001C70FCA8|nr:testis-expressed protein 10-like [Penaeus japonicus]